MRAIASEPGAAYDYTGKGNLVAVVTNGTAVLGLGDVGPIAAKPVMEGKAALFKKFADIDAIDIGLATRDVTTFVDAVALFAGGFGGLNLEDIAAPSCFLIEAELQRRLDIPVFHDDQHGTAVVVLAGLMSACRISGRDLVACRIVVNGAGAAALATVRLLKVWGVPEANVVVCDLHGVVHQGRAIDMNVWKSGVATGSGARTLAEALNGADAFVGLSAADVLTPAMLERMSRPPIVFAMANPDPEIAPGLARAIRPDALLATGRSDLPNQVNNLLCFPFLFRGALDVRASRVTDAMLLAAAEAIARIAAQPPLHADQMAPAKLAAADPRRFIPDPFDSRLLIAVSSAVARAAVASGVARRPIFDWEAYRVELEARGAAMAQY